MRLLLTLLLGVVSCLSCGPQDIRGGRVTSADVPLPPSEAWATHRSFVVAVVHGARYDQYQLSQAVSFFEGVTGIESGLEGSALGFILDREKLADALSHWDAWYREYGDALEWDPNRKTYTVAVEK